MHLRKWFEPPHHLLTLFLATALALAIGLAWLGWSILEQDRALEGQRIEKHLNQLADLISANLSKNIAELEDRIGKISALPEPEAGREASRLAQEVGVDGLVVLFHSQEVDAYPPSSLVYYPSLPISREPPERVFATGETIEFRDKDYAHAIATYRLLARSPDALIRAGALLREARVLRKMHLPLQAGAVYQELAKLDPTPTGGVPAGLVARAAQCGLLAEARQSGELQDEAHALDLDLAGGRWRLTRGVYQFYEQEVSGWLRPETLGDPDPRSTRPTRLALAAGANLLWEQWQRFGEAETTAVGHRSLWTDHHSIFLLWSSTPEALAGMVAAPVYFERQWRAVLGTGGQQDAQITLTDVEGHLVFGQSMSVPHYAVTRATSDTQLPWTLRVVSTNLGADAAESASRRRLLLVGFGLMALVVLAGIYFIARAVTRELEVARLQSDFVSAVSHEFRTPLASLLQRSELLADGRVSSDQQRREYYQALVRESQRLRRLVEGLLDFGRMEAGSREYRFELIETAGLVQSVAEEFSREVAPGGYQIETKLDGSLPPVRGDREALGRALWNLLDNAVKYSPDCKAVCVEAGSQDGRVAIRVRDRGLGIAPGEQGEIFKKFFRATSARQAGVKGTGLGLAMVERITQAHGGRVSVESEPGAGSTFTLRLPAAKE